MKYTDMKSKTIRRDSRDSKEPLVVDDESEQNLESQLKYSVRILSV